MAVSTDVLEEKIEQIGQTTSSQISNLQVSVAQCNSRIDSQEVEINALNLEDNVLLNEINSLSSTVSNNESRIVNIETKDFLSLINAVKDSINNEDTGVLKKIEDLNTEHHNELHEANTKIENNDARLTAIENDWHQINDLNTEFDEYKNSNDAALETMNKEHHEELHEIETNVADIVSRCDAIEVSQAKYPKTVILTTDEYDSIGVKDENTLYFTYDEE